MTDHYLLMTATPHKGDPENFCLFLALLDRDVYGRREEPRGGDAASTRRPFYLRRTKEALVTFPDPETGEVKKLFTKREVRTAAFELDGDEFDFYDALTRYVEDQSIKAAARRLAPAAAPSASRWRCSSGASPRASTPCGAAWSGCATSARRSSTTRRPTGRSRSSAGCPTTSTTCPKTSSRRSSPSSEDVVALGRSGRAARGDRSGSAS